MLVKEPVGRTYLKHEANNENHGNARHNVCMVLYDELMAEYRRVLVGLRASGKRHFLSSQQPSDVAADLMTGNVHCACVL